MQVRFSKVRQAVSQFEMIQCGLSVWCMDKESNVYDGPLSCKTFNFYLWKNDLIGSRVIHNVGEDRFSGQLSSIRFLSEHNMDFNRVFGKGVTYATRRDIEKMREHLEKEFNTKKLKEHLPDDVRRKIDEIVRWYNKGAQDPLDTSVYMDLKGNMNWVNKLLCKYVQRELGAQVKPFLIYIDKNRTTVRVVRRSRLQEYIDAQLNEVRGFSQVIDALVASRLPLVGHIIMLDLAHIIHSCIEPMPTSVLDFKTQVQRLFPLVVDTKLLQPIYYPINKKPLEEAVKILKNNRAFYPVMNEIMNVDDGDSVWEGVKDEDVGKENGKAAVNDDSPARSGDAHPNDIGTTPNGKTTTLNTTRKSHNNHTPDLSVFMHNAGWDAYLTGFVFAKLFVFRTNHPHFRGEYFQSFSETKHIQEYVNRLYLIRALEPLNLADLQQETHDIESFFVLRHLPKSDAKSIHAAIPELRPSNIYPMDKENAIVRLSNAAHEAQVRSKVNPPTLLLPYKSIEDDLCHFVETQGQWRDQSTYASLLAQLPEQGQDTTRVQSKRKRLEDDSSEVVGTRDHKRRRQSNDTDDAQGTRQCVIQ